MPTKIKAGQLLKLGDDYLQHARFTLLTDSQGIADTCDDLGLDAEEVSGMLVHVQDGGYAEVWSTGYRRPYELESVYECVMPGTAAHVRKWEQENVA